MASTSHERIRHSEGPLRHSQRYLEDRAGVITGFHARRGSFDYEHLRRQLRDDVAFARAQASVVDASREVWDRAEAITEDGKFLVERIEGFIQSIQLDETIQDLLDSVNTRQEVWDRAEAITQDGKFAVERLQGLIERVQLDEDVQGELDLIHDTRNTLALDPDDPSQFSSIQQNASKIVSEVARIEGALNSNDPQAWYSSIKQTADTITSEVLRIEGKLNEDDPDLWYSSIKQTADEITSVVSTLNMTSDDPDWETKQYSSIKQNASEISTIVAKLDDPEHPDQFTTITQLADEISLRALQTDLLDVANDLSDLEDVVDGHGQTLAFHTSELSIQAGQIGSIVGRLEHTSVVTGTATGATSTTISDSTKNFVALGIAKGFLIEITTGANAREIKTISDVSQTTITVSDAWTTTPSPGDGYRISSPSVIASSALTQQAGEISLRVTLTEFDDLAEDVSTNTSNISVLSDTITNEVARIEGNLNSSNLNVWYSSIKQTADEITSVVSRLNMTPDHQDWDTLQYSSIKQTVDRIESVVTTLNMDLNDPDWDTEQFSSIKQTASEINSVVTMLNDSATAQGQYTSIKQTAETVQSIVSELESDIEDTHNYSIFTQLINEIDLRVRKDGVIAAINLSEEGVRILGKQIQLDGDVFIDGNFKVTGKNITLDGDTTVLGTFTVGKANIEDASITNLKIANGEVSPNKWLWRTPGTAYEVVASNDETISRFSGTRDFADDRISRVWKAKEFLVNWPGKYTVRVESKWEIAAPGAEGPVRIAWVAATAGFDEWPAGASRAMQRIGLLTDPQSIPQDTYTVHDKEMQVHVGTGQRIAILVYVESEADSNGDPITDVNVYLRNVSLRSDTPNDGDVGGGMSTLALT